MIHTFSRLGSLTLVFALALFAAHCGGEGDDSGTDGDADQPGGSEIILSVWDLTLDPPATGTIDFRADMTFLQDATSEGGHHLAGGDYAFDSDGADATHALSFHYTWYQYDAMDRVDYDGHTYTGTVTEGTRSYDLVADDGATGTISR